MLWPRGGSWIFPYFQWKIMDWRALVAQTAAWPKHLAEIISCEPTYMGLCGASGFGVGGVWIDPWGSVCILVLCHPWPLDIINNLVSTTNLELHITNCNPAIASLILHKSTITAAVLEAWMSATRYGSYNTLILLWNMCEASTINPVITELLRIYALHSRQFFLNPFFFYHLGQDNCMPYGASCLFDFPDTLFLVHMYVTHPQPLSLWKISSPPLGLLPCVISTLCRNLCNRVLISMWDSKVCTSSGCTSAPPCW